MSRQSRAATRRFSKRVNLVLFIVIVAVVVLVAALVVRFAAGVIHGL